MNGSGELEGDEINESCKLIVFSTVLEPISSKSLPYPVANPSGIKVGGTATYQISVTPSTISDSEITWSSTNANISFPSGNQGRSVSVSATSQGLAQLKVDIAGFSKAPPTINVKGVTNSTVGISFFIICDTNGNPAVSSVVVSNALVRANDIYEQVSMNFTQKGSITYITNSNPDWFVLRYGDDNNPWPDFPSLVAYTNNTGSLEVYFVSTIEKAAGLCSTDNRGIAIAENASANTMAHEIGHTCGLKDIYYDQGGVYISQTNLAMSSWAPQDWNNGPGNMYYQPDTPQNWLISKMLMYGVDTASGTVDIPLGSIYGVYKTSTTNYAKGLVKVGLDNNGFPMNRNPVSN